MNDNACADLLFCLEHGIPCEVSALEKHPDDPAWFAEVRDDYVPEDDDCNMPFADVDDDGWPCDGEDLIANASSLDCGTLVAIYSLRFTHIATTPLQFLFVPELLMWLQTTCKRM